MEVLAFCSWSACRMNSRSSASAATGSTVVRLAGHCEEHVQQVGAVREIVARIDEGLAKGVLVGRGGDGRNLRNDAMREDLAVARIVDVGGVVVERRHRGDDRGHHRHRVRIVVETAEEAQQRLVQHRVATDVVDEFLELRLLRQLAVQQQVADLHVAALLGQLLDGVATMQQHAGIAVDIGDLASQAEVSPKPGSCVNTPRSFEILAISTTDGPMVPSLTGRTLFLPDAVSISSKVFSAMACAFSRGVASSLTRSKLSMHWIDRDYSTTFTYSPIGNGLFGYTPLISSSSSLWYFSAGMFLGVFRQACLRGGAHYAYAIRLCQGVLGGPQVTGGLGHRAEQAIGPRAGHCARSGWHRHK